MLILKAEKLPFVPVRVCAVLCDEFFWRNMVGMNYPKLTARYLLTHLPSADYQLTQMDYRDAGVQEIIASKPHLIVLEWDPVLLEEMMALARAIRTEKELLNVPVLGTFDISQQNAIDNSFHNDYYNTIDSFVVAPIHPVELQTMIARLLSGERKKVLSSGT